MRKLLRGKLVEYRLRFLLIARVEPFRKPPVNRSQIATLARLPLRGITNFREIRVHT
jgi:hypothetical protein